MGLLTPEELAFLNEELGGIEVKDIVGFGGLGRYLIVDVRS